MKNLFLTTLFLSVLFVSAQPFEKTYPYMNYGFADDLEVNDNGYTLAGFGYLFNRYTMFLIHTNLDGDTLSTSYPDYGMLGLADARIITGSDGCHYAAVPNGNEANLVKFSPGWQEIWRKKNDSYRIINEFCLSADGNLLVSARSDKPYLMKIDTSGSIIWQSEIPYYNEFPNTKSLLETSTGEILLCIHIPNMWGYTSNNELYIYSAAGQLTETGMLDPDPDGNCIVPTTINYQDHFVSICSVYEGKTYLVHHLPDGTILSQKEISLPFESFHFDKMILNNSNELVVIGWGFNNNSDSHASIIYGMSAGGDSLWMNIRQYELQFVKSNVVLCSDGGYVISGAEVDPDTGIFHPMMIKTDPWGGSSPLNMETLAAKSSLSVYPIPAVDQVVFESSEPLYGIISIIDMGGRKVASLRTTGLKTELQTGGLKPGMYFYKIENKGDILTGRLIIGL